MAKWRTKKTAGGEKEGGDKQLAPMKGRRSSVAADAPADQEVVMISVPVHCDGCARKLRRSLLRLDGVEEAIVEHSTDTVVVMGRKALENPMKVVETVERRTGKKALLLSPSPEKLPPQSAAKTETKKHDVADLDMEMVVILRIELHCDACCEEMKRRILNIKGVEEAVPDIKSSELMVRGRVEPATLVGFIHKCTERRAAIIRAEPLDALPAEANPLAPLPDLKTPADANVEQQDNLEEKNEGAKEEKTKGPGGGEESVDEMKMEEPGKGNGVVVEEEITNKNMPNDASSGVTEENQLMKDHLFKLPMPAAVFAEAPAESQKMAMNNIYPYYYQQPACAYGYPNCAYQPYQFPAYQPYGPYPHCPQQTFGYDNPDGCTIM